MRFPLNGAAAAERADFGTPQPQGAVRRLMGRPQVIEQVPSVLVVDENAIHFYGMDGEDALAEAAGAADAAAGVHNPHAFAGVPSATRIIIGKACSNLHALRGFYRGRRVGLLGERRQTKETLLAREGALEESEEKIATLGRSLDASPREASGWLNPKGWIVLAVAVLIAAADVLLTQKALVIAMDDLPENEAWIIAGLVGLLVFGAGLGEAYVHAMKDNRPAEDTGGLDHRSLRRLSQWVVVPASVLLAGLALGRIGLLIEPRTPLEWAEAIGGFLAVTAAAVLVAVATYLGGRLLLAARDRNRMIRSLSRETRRRDALLVELASLRAQLDRLDEREVALARLYEEAASVCVERWGQTLHCYWVHWARRRAEEEPDLPEVHAQDFHRMRELAAAVVS